MSFLALAEQICADLGVGVGSELEIGPIVEVKSAIAAVVIDSKRYGEVWLVLDPRMVDELAAEEATRSNPRPILRAEDVVRFKGRPEGAVQAALDVLRVFPGTRVIQ